MDIVSGIGFGLLILFALSVVVFLHEGGHYLAARWAGVEVEAFAVGMGKVLWSWKPGTTEYRICLFPIGGYCKMKGEQDLIAAMGKASDEVEASPGSLFAAPWWKRIIISVAGPAANFVTALLVFTVLFLVGTPSVGPSAKVLLAADVDGRTGSAAEAAGLATGDVIVSVNGRNLETFSQLQEVIANGGGRPQVWTIDRGGLSLQKTVTPVADQTGRPVVGVYPFNPPVVKTVVPRSPGALGGFQVGDLIVQVDERPVVADQEFFYLVSQTTTSLAVTVERRGQRVDLTLVPEGPSTPLGLGFEMPRHPARGLPPLAAVAAGAQKTMALLGQMIQGLAGLFTGKEDPVQSLSGPIGIVGQGSQMVSSAFGIGVDFGFSALVNLVAFLSLALFLMNLLPIPALDGGSVVISAIEGLRRKRLGLKALLAYQQVGVFLVLGLILFTTLNDLGVFGKL